MEGANIKPIISEDVDKITNSLYVNLRSIELTDIFVYLCSLCISLYIIRKLRVNVYLALSVVIILILLDISKKYVYKTVAKDHLLDNLNAIVPHPINFDKYPDLINLFFGLKQLSELNFVEFSNVVYNTDAVIGIYNDVLKGLRNCKQNYDIAIQRATEALKALHNLIYGINTDDTVMKKYHDSLNILQRILNTFLDKIKRSCESQLKKNGFNNGSSIIFPGPVPCHESMLKVNKYDLTLDDYNSSDYY